MVFNKVVILLFLASVGDPINCLQVEDEEESGSGSFCILEQLGQADLSLQQRTQELSSKVLQLRADKQQLNSTVQQLQGNNRQLASAVEALETEKEKMIAKVSALENHSQKQSAFSAYMTVGYFEPNNSTAIVVPMNGVQFNVNNDYSSATSTYTCPVDGVYYFSYAIYSTGIQESSDDRLFAFLAINGQLQNEAYCQTDTDVKIYCQSTNGDTVHCNQGDRVQILTHSNSRKNQIYGKSNYKRTTFTGHLLYAD